MVSVELLGDVGERRKCMVGTRGRSIRASRNGFRSSKVLLHIDVIPTFLTS